MVIDNNKSLYYKSVKDYGANIFNIDTKNVNNVL